MKHVHVILQISIEKIHIFKSFYSSQTYAAIWLKKEGAEEKGEKDVFFYLTGINFM